MIGRPFGIPVQVSPYWFLIAAVFVVIYARDLAGALRGGTAILVAIVFVVLLYLSVLVHELSHSVVALGYGLPVRRILLYPLGGISEIEAEPQTPLREFVVSAAGPALSLLLGGIFFGVHLLVPAATIGGIVVQQLVVANVIVGLFNLLPGLPLDGGRMLRAVVWWLTGRPSVATVVAGWVGRALAVALLFAPFAVAAVLAVGVSWVDVGCAVALAAFIWLYAGQSLRANRMRRRLPGVHARRLARRAIPIPASLPLAEAVRRADETNARALVIVDHASRPIAIVDESAVTATPPDRRPWIEAGTLARSLEPDLVLPADLSGLALLDAVRRTPASEYLLVEPSGQVYGVLAATDLDEAFAGV